MKQLSRQRGITLLGLIMVLFLIGFAAFIGMKLLPVYQEYFSVVQGMKSVAAQPGIANRQGPEIKEMLMKRFYISYVESVKRQHIKVVRKNVLTVQIQYEVRRSLLGNIDFVAKFDKTVDLKG